MPPTGRKLDPLAQVPDEVLDKVQRHADRVIHGASKELVVSYNAFINLPVKAPGSVKERAEKRVCSVLATDNSPGGIEHLHARIGVCPKVLGAVAAAGAEQLISDPSQASHMRTLVSEAENFHGGQTSSTANAAFKEMSTHMVQNIMNNPLVQHAWGIGGYAHTTKLEVLNLLVLFPDVLLADFFFYLERMCLRRLCHPMLAC